MSRYYDKDKLKESLEPEQIYDLLEAWGGEPAMQDNCIISDTICHNLPGRGSHKLYYYYGTRLLHCYTGCVDPSFDIFDLCIKVMRIQKNLSWELYDAMDYIASYFGLQGEEVNNEQQKELKDWEVFKKHKIDKPAQILKIPVLPEFDSAILSRFSYPRIIPWEQEGISKEICRDNQIGYYPGGQQIVIPHFDINNRLVGIRGRYLVDDLADRYGKYRPLIINKELYNHPLSMNLYNLNKSKENIRSCHTAIIFESEKSALQYQTFYGHDNDISVACCGSSLSVYQVNLLKSIGTKEIVIAFDRQFQEIGDDEFKRLKAKLLHIYNRYKNTIKVTIIFDKEMRTPYKASPTDRGPQLFEKLLKERIVL